MKDELGHKGVGKEMDPDTINCVILRIYVDNKNILAMPSSGKLV